MKISPKVKLSVASLLAIFATSACTTANYTTKPNAPQLPASKKPTGGGTTAVSVAPKRVFPPLPGLKKIEADTCANNTVRFGSVNKDLSAAADDAMIRVQGFFEQKAAAQPGQHLPGLDADARSPGISYYIGREPSDNTPMPFTVRVRADSKPVVDAKCNQNPAPPVAFGY